MIMRTTKKPKFIRQGGKSIKRLEEKWRRPRGKQSKLRRHMRSRGNIPHPGYGTSKKLRGLHPSGLEDILVHNVAELEKLGKVETTFGPVLFGGKEFYGINRQLHRTVYITTARDGKIVTLEAVFPEILN